MTTSDPVAVETAWKIHAALADWTGKVDAKASFALTVESAVLVAIGAIFNAGDRLRHLTGFWTNGFFWTGVAFIAVAALYAIAVVSPNIRRRAMPTEGSENFVFFGHLKQWKADDLVEALKTKDPLPVLSRQLIVMSEIAWTKHARVRISFILAVVGSALVALAGVMA
ncbi:DUF5706 domain-containing protein [Kitasatospora sp. NBC_00240]|uniref:Pycsar system effector family protein n=1 Tax=Kitasatospora sp. NBC_00240 TaxID=2903567 RepID=UPI00224D89D2|nr:Pycsar system effector family protein [Kitasatospora sp. NBC_00240]MCX5215634.1 DUF5706 domain-containing protein [Kitasatospora sp. NBC_00240]